MSVVRVINQTRGVLVAGQVEIARTFWPRLMGLIGRRTLCANAGLFLERCGAIHTFGVRFPIDVVFLDRNNRVLRMVEQLSPCRVIGAGGRATSTLELPAGALTRTPVEVGDLLELIPSQESHRKAD